MCTILKNPCRSASVAIAVCVVHFLGCQDVEATEIEIVKNGTPCAEIVVARDASKPELFAASELAEYVKKLSGADLHVGIEGQGVGRTAGADINQLILGTPSTSAKVRELLQAAQVNPSELGEDGFLIRPVDGGLLLCGNNGRAVLYAVYDLLERFGCRWFAPGELGEIVPNSGTLTFAQDAVLEKPALSCRGMMHHLPVTPEHVHWVDWMAKNRLNWLLLPLRVNPQDQPTEQNFEETMRILGDEIIKRGFKIEASHHSFTSYWIRKEEYFQPHPEWFAMRDGKRVPWQLCLTNYELIETMTAKVLEFIRRNPEVDIVGLYADDGQRYCQCKKCAALGKTDHYTQFVSKVASAVYEKYPDKKISYIAYGETLSPPKKPIFGRNTVLSIAGRRRENDPVLTAWKEKDAREIYIYEYSMGQGYYSNMCMPYDWPRSTARALALYEKLGVSGAVPQTELYNFYTYFRNYYTFARFSWNPHQNIDALLDDLYEKFYAEAAPQMKRFYDGWHITSKPDLKQISHPELRVTSKEEPDRRGALLLEAEKTARDGKVTARIAKTRISYEYVKFMWNTMDAYGRMLACKHDGRTADAMKALEETKTWVKQLSRFMIEYKDEWVFLAAEKNHQRYCSAPLQVKVLNPFLSKHNQERLSRFIQAR